MSSILQPFLLRKGRVAYESESHHNYRYPTLIYTCYRHLGAGGRGVGDHGLEHVGGHDDRLAALAAPLHDAALPVGHLRVA